MEAAKFPSYQSRSRSSSLDEGSSSSHSTTSDQSSTHSSTSLSCTSSESSSLDEQHKQREEALSAIIEEIEIWHSNHPAFEWDSSSIESDSSMSSLEEKECRVVLLMMQIVGAHTGDGAEQDFDLCWQWFSKALQLLPKLLEDDGICEVVFTWANKNFESKSYATAFEQYSLIKQYAIPDVIKNLAWMYHKGLGVEQNYIEAKKCYGLYYSLISPNSISPTSHEGYISSVRKLQEDTHDLACNHIKHNENVDKALHASISLSVLVEDSYYEAAYDLAELYRKDGKPGDAEFALKYYSLATTHIYDAAFRMAEYYERGADGIKQDVAAALKLYLKASMTIPKASYRAGHLLHYQYEALGRPALPFEAAYERYLDALRRGDWQVQNFVHIEMQNLCKAVLVLAKNNLASGSINEAERQFMFITEIDEASYGEARFQLGLLALAKKKPEDAKLYFRKSKEAGHVGGKCFYNDDIKPLITASKSDDSTINGCGEMSYRVAIKVKEDLIQTKRVSKYLMRAYKQGRLATLNDIFLYSEERRQDSTKFIYRWKLEELVKEADTLLAFAAKNGHAEAITVKESLNAEAKQKQDGLDTKIKLKEKELIEKAEQKYQESANEPL